MPTPENFELPVINSNPSKRRPPPGRGRPRGAVNKASKDLKQGLLTAAANLGFDGNGERGLVGFLEYLGLYHTKSFAHLLSKMIPLNLNATSINATVSSINIVSVPSGSYFTPEQAAQFQPVLQMECDAVEAEIAPEAEPINVGAAEIDTVVRLVHSPSHRR